MKTKSLFSVLALSTILILFFSTLTTCKKNSEDPPPVPGKIPTVTTESITNVGQTTANCGGNVTSQGSSPVTSRGVCWSTSSNPTIANSRTLDGTGTGSFTSNFSGLTPNTPYYVRAYATNSEGTAYGNQVDFTTSGSVSLPVVTTSSVTNITQTIANCGGNVTEQGSSPVTARGVCWSTSSNPTIANSHTSDDTGTGSFTSSISGLTPNTPYHVRAYATNNGGTSYGNQVDFTTLSNSSGQPCPGMPTFNDTRDGQVYATVQIGNQCWLQKNMNYQTGNSWCYDDNPSNCNTYGRLYDWTTALDVCPSGWHLPSDAEWCTLTQYVDPTVYCNITGYSGTDAGLKMKSTSGWYNNGNGTNSSGFNALPAGYRGSNGFFGFLTYNATFWSSTEYSSTDAWRRYFPYDYENLNRNYFYKTYGFSVRCVRD